MLGLSKMERVYRNYCEKNPKHIKKKEFFYLYKVCLKNLITLKEKSKEPYIAMIIDDNYILYMEINKKNIVINIWDNEQYKLLLRR